MILRKCTIEDIIFNRVIDRCMALLFDPYPDIVSQSLICITEYVDMDDECFWNICRVLCESASSDIRASTACIVLEHLIEHDYEKNYARAKAQAEKSKRFSEALSMCWYRRGRQYFMGERSLTDESSELQ